MKMKYLALMLAVSYGAHANIYEAKPERGLFWGEKPVKEEKKEEEYPKPVIPSQAEMMKMHPKQIRELLEEAHEYAVYTQKPEDVYQYMTVLDVVRRKSAAFANVQGYVTMQHPELNGRSAYGFTNPSRKEIRKSRTEKVEHMITLNRNDYAMIIFVRKNCPVCPVQLDILKNFRDKYGWDFEIVDIDEEPRMISRFNVTTTPLTIAISRKKKDAWFPVAVGAESLTGMTLNSYRAMRVLGGAITPEQFYMNETQKGTYFDPSSVGN
ncbi:conjugal transfer protein TraF [Vibrio harveyi]|uniref:conjugal transfer protein TraF n=1 Tax=Vibrio harveyi TaxID=669 RepID=UPI003BB7FBAF